MNEKIRELAEQAGYSTDPVPYLNPGVDPRLEKFAELIVRDCIKAVDNSGGDNAEYHTDSIKKHFGVAE